MQITMIGLDLDKQVFQLHVLNTEASRVQAPAPRHTVSQEGPTCRQREDIISIRII